MKTLSQTLTDLRREGAVIDLHVDDAIRLRVGDPPMTCTPRDVRMVWTRRFEGQSNPDDLAILYGLQLPNGRVGVLVDGYGPSSDPKVTTFIRAVQPAIQ